MAAGFAFPIVHLEGSPFDRGRRHGARFRHEIATALEALRRAYGPAAYAAAGDRAQAAWPLIVSRAPDIGAELQGIAEGCGAALTDILLRVGFEFFDAAPAAGCTAIACRGRQGAIVAQNWDAPPGVGQELALFIHSGARGFEQAVIASVGGLAWVGCNRHGLALLNTDLMLHSRAPGLPSQVVRRIVLGARRVEDALAVLGALPHMAGRFYLLGDAAGAIAGVEVSAARGLRVTRGPGPILHTNHALHPDIVEDEDEDTLMKTYPSSWHRLGVLQRIAADVSSADHVMTALKDRDGAPDSICKSRSDAEATETTFSIVVECGRGGLQVCPGSPAEHAYSAVALPAS